MIFYNPQNRSSPLLRLHQGIGLGIWNLFEKGRKRKFLVASCDFQQELVEYPEIERERERPTFSIAFEAKRIKFN